MKLFCLDENRSLAEAVAERSGVELAKHEERAFGNGEFKVRPLESVRHEQVFLCESVYGDASRSPSDRLIRLLFFIGAVKDAGAGEIVVLLPYLAFMRKDARTKERDPVATRYIAAALETTGMDVIVTIDAHNLIAFDNAFRCAKENLSAAPLFAAHFGARLRDAERIVAVSPDSGGVKRARAFSVALGERLGRRVDLAFVEKHRSEGRVTGAAFAGDVQDAAVVIIDDLVSGGTTLARAAEACRERGAREVHAAATHAAYTASADEVLSSAGLESMVVTDTIPAASSRCPSMGKRQVVLECSALLAAAVERLRRTAV